MTRIAIIAATFSGNRGAEAMVSTTIGRVRTSVPDATFAVYSYYPEEDRALVSDPAVRIHSSTPAYLVAVLFPGALVLGALSKLGLGRPFAPLFPASVRDLRDSAVLLDLAGVAFIDGREKFLPFNVLTIWPAMLVGIPVVKLSQAMGPFRNPLNRFCARIWLRRCAAVYARGARTAEHLRELGLPQGLLRRAADIALGLEASHSLTTENPAHLASLITALDTMREEGRIVVAVCPSAVIAGKAAKAGWDYTGLLARIVDHLLGLGHAVLLVPNATREAAGEKLRNNDLPVIAAVVSRLREGGTDLEKVAWVAHDVNAAGIKALLGRSDAALVSRFHAMVGALSAGVPVLVLGWSHKYREVMEQFDLGEWALDHSEGDEGTLIARLDELLDRRTELTARIAKHSRAAIESSETQFEEVAHLIETGALPPHAPKH